VLNDDGSGSKWKEAAVAKFETDSCPTVLLTRLWKATKNLRKTGVPGEIRTGYLSTNETHYRLSQLALQLIGVIQQYCAHQSPEFRFTVACLLVHRFVSSKTEENGLVRIFQQHF
jgi:hypothetical protein